MALLVALNLMMQNRPIFHWEPLHLERLPKAGLGMQFLMVLNWTIVHLKLLHLEFPPGAEPEV